MLGRGEGSSSALRSLPRPHACALRAPGAPNCAPSLRSVAGLLLTLALESRCEDPLPTSHGVPDSQRSRPRLAWGLLHPPSHARVARRAPLGIPATKCASDLARAGRSALRAGAFAIRSYRSVQGGERVLGGASGAKPDVRESCRAHVHQAGDGSAPKRIPSPTANTDATGIAFSLAARSSADHPTSARAGDRRSDHRPYPY